MALKIGWFQNFGLKYVFVVCWCGISVALFVKTFLYYTNSLEYFYVREILGFSLSVSKAAAAVLNLNCAVILLPMCHTIIVLIRKVSRKINCLVRFKCEARSFHTYIGYIILLSSAAHVISHIIATQRFWNNFNDEITDVNPFPVRKQIPLHVLCETVSGVTGLLLVLVLLLLILTSLRQIRRRFYNLFWYTHRLFVVFYLLLLIHGIQGPIMRQLNVDSHHPGCRRSLNTVSGKNSSTIDTSPFSVLNETSDTEQSNFNETNDVTSEISKETINMKFSNFNTAIASMQTRSNNTINSTFGSSLVDLNESSTQVSSLNTVSQPSNSTDDVIETKICSEDPIFGHTESEAWKWLCLPMLLYTCDFVCRVLRRTPTAEVVSVEELSSDVFEIRLMKQDIKMQPGQYVLLNCTKVSTLEWHPFSVVKIASIATGWTFVLWIKVSGDWTEDFKELIHNIPNTVKDAEAKIIRYPNVRMDGPFSSPMENVSKFKTTICVGGGIGVTPFLSHIWQIRAKLNSKSKMRKLYFIFITRDEKLLSRCAEISQKAYDMMKILKPGLLDIRFFLTDTKRQITEDEFILQRLKRGRPDFDHMFKNICINHSKGTIGVFSCGPDSLNKVIKKQCIKHSNMNLKLCFHNEMFQK